MVLPGAEVSNVASLDIGCPADGGIEDGVIQPDREQDERATPRLFVERLLDLALDPGPFDRGVGEDDEELVSNPDGLVEGGPKLVADLEILRCEPAADTFVLQVGMEALGKFMVLVRVADEAGIELDRLIQKRRQVVDEVVGQTAAAQKSKGQRTGAFQGALVDGARSVMITVIQALGVGQVGVREYGLI